MPSEAQARIAINRLPHRQRATAGRALVSTPAALSERTPRAKAPARPESITPMRTPLVRSPPVRTAFSITLQLGRCCPALVVLVRSAYCDDPAAARAAAGRVAAGILRGARDRSRDPHIRPLLDQQLRTEPMTDVRKRIKRAELGSGSRIATV